MLKVGKVIAINVVAFALVACGNNSTDKQEQAGAPSTSAVNTAPAGELTQASLPDAYSGTLPCGDCKGVVTKLNLLEDGTYTLHETFDGKEKGGMLESKGKWALDVATRRATLDPLAQDWEDRVFEVVASGALRPLDGNGAPYSNEGLNDLQVSK